MTPFFRFFNEQNYLFRIFQEIFVFILKRKSFQATNTGEFNMTFDVDSDYEVNLFVIE